MIQNQIIAGTNIPQSGGDPIGDPAAAVTFNAGLSNVETNSHYLVHRVISRRQTAVGQLADFQGANDEHPAPVFAILLICIDAASAKLVRDVRSESGRLA